MAFTIFRNLAAVCSLLLAITAVHESRAQQGLPKVGCMDQQIRLQADEIKQHYIAQGMEVMRDAMLSMESQTPYPVMINLERGQLYQIVFVAHPEATRLFLELYDGADQKMKEIMQSYGRGQPTYVIFTFMPEVSDMYMFVMRQKWKTKDMCGSFSILKPKKGTTGALQLKAYQPQL